MKPSEQVVLITAATRGIGLACAQRFSRDGAFVFLAARDLSRAQRIADELNAAGGRVRCVYHDATKPETFLSMVKDTVRAAGRLDVLVNNFGISAPGRDLDFLHTDAQVFLDTVLINLRSVFLASQAAARHMAQRGGSIINISSIGGIVPDVTQVAYGTGKAAINHLTKLIAVQGAAYGIRCNAVLPGMTATDAVQKHLPDAFRAAFLRHTPLGRMAKPEEIADAAAYLAGEGAAYVTGQLLCVSGGFGLATPLYGAQEHGATQDSP